MYPQVVRRRPQQRVGWLACAIGAWLALSPCALAGETVDPLDVPRGSGPAPEQLAELGFEERLERGLEAQRDRGFLERPVLGWALLQEGRRTSDRALIRRAIEAAPNTPAVRLGALSEGVVGDPLSALLSLGRSFPALVWLLSVGALTLGCAILFAACACALIGFGRTLMLHGHALGHRLPLSEPLAWPAALAICAVLACLPLFGVGIGMWLGVCGAVAALRLPSRQSQAMAALLVLSGLALGPGLDLGVRLITQPSATPVLTAAWRFDWSQPLPGDAEILEAEVARSASADPFLVYAWANALKHLGDGERARTLLVSRPQASSRLLEERSSNLLGILRLAQGDATGALEEFERARAMGESATVLYNLSQTYARSVELLKRESLYAAAQDLDPDRVSRYAALEGANVHRYVIQEPLPLSAYLGRALSDNIDARVLAARVRDAALGARLPSGAWLALPLLGVIVAVLRRSDVARCRRCDRILCSTCDAGVALETCTRCDRLFSGRAKIDARLRKQQGELDRLQQRRLRYARAAVALIVPGAGTWLHEGAWAGALRALCVGAALGLWTATRWIPAPFEIGDLTALLAPCALGLVVLCFAFEAWRIRRDLFPKVRS